MKKRTEFRFVDRKDILPRMLMIEGRAVGQRKPLFDGFSVPPPDNLDGGEPLKLRDLIEHVVLNEVSAFEKRQEKRRLDRVLSPRDMETGEAKGKINPEGRDPKLAPPKPVDRAAAVQAALEAFIDGLYLVVIDGDEYRDLEQIVRITDQSKLTFIRLTFLAGA
jgi:hypothetical protein